MNKFGWKTGSGRPTVDRHAGKARWLPVAALETLSQTQAGSHRASLPRLGEHVHASPA